MEERTYCHWRTVHVQPNFFPWSGYALNSDSTLRTSSRTRSQQYPLILKTKGGMNCYRPHAMPSAPLPNKTLSAVNNRFMYQNSALHSVHSTFHKPDLAQKLK